MAAHDAFLPAGDGVQLSWPHLSARLSLAWLRTAIWIHLDRIKVVCDEFGGSYYKLCAIPRVGPEIE